MKEARDVAPIRHFGRIFIISIFTLLGITNMASANSEGCTTIQEGTLLTSDGEVVVLGFDDWGYNYQGRVFHGKYCDAYRGADWCLPYAEDDLLMKWNEAWLSNQDCDLDGDLDRHYGHPSYIGSGAWLTNEQSGIYQDDNGKTQRWTYFVKIVAAPEGAWVSDNSWWITDELGDELELGPVIWGSFAVVMQVETDTGDPTLHGVLYRSPVDVGLGILTPP